MKFGVGSWQKERQSAHWRVAPPRPFPREIAILGSGFVSRRAGAPCTLCEAEASLALAADNLLIARVRKARTGMVRVARRTEPADPVHIGLQIGRQFASVGDPAVDHDGNIM